MCPRLPVGLRVCVWLDFVCCVALQRSPACVAGAGLFHFSDGELLVPGALTGSQLHTSSLLINQVDQGALVVSLQTALARAERTLTSLLTLLGVSTSSDGSIESGANISTPALLALVNASAAQTLWIAGASETLGLDSVTGVNTADGSLQRLQKFIDDAQVHGRAHS